MEIYPLTAFSGVIIHDQGKWWVVGCGCVSSGAWFGARSINPDPRQDPREHWGRICRSLASPRTIALWLILERLARGREQHHKLFGGLSLSLEGASRRVSAQQDLVVFPTEKGLLVGAGRIIGYGVHYNHRADYSFLTAAEVARIFAQAGWGVADPVVEERPVVWRSSGQ